MTVVSWTEVPPRALLEQARAVYLAAFAEPPYEEPASRADDFVRRVEQYAVEREGFRLVLAQDDAGTVTGLVLSVVARPGDWWREQVATALGPEGAERWLGSACVEIVHVAVDPARRSQGIGAAIMEQLHRDAVAPRGVLTLDPRAVTARRLYERLGWTPALQDLRFGDAPVVWLLGRDLP